MIKDEIKIYVSFESMVLSIAPKHHNQNNASKWTIYFYSEVKEVVSVVVLGLTSQYDVRVLLSP